MDTELHKELYQRGFIANFTVDQLYVGSKETKNLEQYVRKIAQYSAPVLILGEKGSGAEFLAQAIHNASPLSKSAFVPVDCDAWMPETLDDMLFGSYTSRQGTPPCLAELAADGTLYLNGIEMLSRESQYKMLNLIRGKFMHNGSHRVSFTKVRVIASTSVNLAAKVEKGEFRQDLYYALSSLSTEIPPLRHQKEYTLFWFNHYIDQWQKQYKRYIHMTQGALRFVQEYDWPGNLEQMASVTERIVLLTEKRSIDEAFVKKQMEQILPDILPGTEKVVLYKDKEAARIAELLKKYGGNREKVAAELGISKTTLWRRIKKYGIEKDFSF
jgi:DNA-binding NtrC family response regulator